MIANLTGHDPGARRPGSDAARWLRLGVVALLMLALTACSDDAAEEADEADVTDTTGASDGADATDAIDASDTIDGADEEVDARPIPDQLSIPDRIFAVETVVLNAPVAAGSQVIVACRPLNEAGEPFEIPADAGVASEVLFAPTESFIVDDDVWTPIRVGQAQATCAIFALGVIDATPAEFEVVAGPAHTVVTALDARTVGAGTPVTASCEVFDAYGNPVPDATPTVAVSSAGSGVVVDGEVVTIDAAGFHAVTCEEEGAQQLISADLEVLPSLPAALAVAPVPDQPVYGLGQVITLSALVTDRFGNPIPDALVTRTSAPAGVDFGQGRFRFDVEGVYTLRAVVEPPLDPSVSELIAEVDVVVNGTGPTIACASPVADSMVDAAPGSTLTFRGAVDDTNGVASVEVGGQSVTLASDGSFEAPVTVRYGMNFIDVVATDAFGERNVRTCTFLASDHWYGESATIGDTISLRLQQEAIDDLNRSGPIDSLGDLLATVVNSPGLRDTLHDTLRNTNNGVLVPNQCFGEEVCVFGSCACLGARAKVTYLDMVIDGPSTVRLDLVSGGMRASIRVENVGIKLDFDTSLGDTVGWVNIDALVMTLTFDTTLQGGQPRITVRQVDHVALEGLSTDFDGFLGFLVDVVAGLFSGQIGDLIENELRDYIESSFNDILDGVVSGLDISTLGASLPVPRLDGSGQIMVNFGVAFTHLTSTTSRMLFGIGSRFTVSAPVNATPSLGVALPPGSLRRDIGAARPASVSIHIGLFNQVLHALWRGGLFDATLGGGGFGDVPDGLSVTLQSALPPVAEIDGAENRVILMLGGLRLSLVYPGLFDEPLILELGAVATTSITLNGDDLSFGGLAIEELHFSSPQISLDPATRDILEGFLIDLVDQLVGAALNDALPALPIPSFELPASLAPFGLPAGAVLGLVNPTLSSSGNHLVLESGFGVQ